jgi:hypothetical protein
VRVRLVRIEAAGPKKWVSLFNGNDLTGWVVDSGPKQAWKVEEGAIVGQGRGSASRGWLLSERSYGDFVLKAQFQLVGGEVDGAVGFRACSGEKEGRLPMHLAVKLRSQPIRQVETGSLYYWPNTAEPPNRPARLRQAGSWNDLTIELRGQQLRVAVNGQDIQSLDLNRIARREKVLPGVKRTSGRIGLQQHSGKVLFRDIQIGALTEPGADVQGRRDDPKDGWVQLFNGKDLTGWKVFPGGTGEWKVKDGLLIGSGPRSHLFTRRGDYRDFHLRAEVKINDRGNSGLYFRSPFGPNWPLGYEAQINVTHNDPIKTGSLHPAWHADLKGVKQIQVLKAPHGPDEWFTHEVIAVGPKITILVNGKKTVEWTDPKHRHKEGHFALQQFQLGSVVQFRKIEVKELAEVRGE